MGDRQPDNRKIQPTFSLARIVVLYPKMTEKWRTKKRSCNRRCREQYQNRREDRRQHVNFSALHAAQPRDLHLYYGGGLDSRRGGMHALQRSFRGECRLLLHGVRSKGWLLCWLIGRCDDTDRHLCAPVCREWIQCTNSVVASQRDDLCVAYCV